ncbi:MAG: phenylacetate--CoA ligase family protein [Desulfobaccales bacterium]
MLKTCYQQSHINVLVKMFAAKKAEGLSAGQLQDLQTRRFKKLLRHVLQYSRFYQWHYKKHGITLENIENVSVKDLPPINKELMMDHYDDFVCDRFLKRKNIEEFLSRCQEPRKKYHHRYTVIHTSGSSGTISLFVYGPEDWAVVRALVVARVIKPMPYFYRRIRLSFIGATDGHYAGVSLASEVPFLYGRFLPLSINSPLEAIDQKSNAFRPDVVSGYASGVHLMAQEQLKRKSAIRPDRIICTSDPLTHEMRHTIKKAFGREPVNYYAGSESLSMAAQCNRYENLHLFTDWHIFEAVDDDLRPVAAGTPANLLLTNLYNYTQPLIRYQMHDEIVMNQEPCGCGSPLPTIRNLAGRQEEFLWFDTAEGKRDYLHPIVLVELFVAGLKKFQVIQTQRNEMLMKVIIDGKREAVLAAIRQRMQEIFSGKKLDKTVQLNLEIVEDIPNDPITGKFKLIIPLKH